jgi:alpha-L-fucosidase 2
LDLDTAVITTRYTVGGTTFMREMFASYPAHVIVLRLTVDKPGALTFSVGLNTQHYGRTAITANEISVTGRTPVRISGPVATAKVEWDEHTGTTLEALLHVAAKGGSIVAGKDTLAPGSCVNSTIRQLLGHRTPPANPTSETTPAASNMTT